MDRQNIDRDDLSDPFDHFDRRVRHCREHVFDHFRLLVIGDAQFRLAEKLTRFIKSARNTNEG